MRKKLRLAWFSALEGPSLPSESKSAYFSSLVLPRLEQLFEIELFTDRFECSGAKHYLSAFKAHQANPFDLCFYQVEQGRHSHFTRMHLALMPGAVLFHDFLFTDSGPESLVESEWCETLYGPELDWLKSPIGHREGGLSRLALFSDARMHDEFRRSVGGKLKLSAGQKAPASYFIPMPVNTGLPLVERGAENKIVFCGTPAIEHRSHKLLEAMHNIETPYTLHWLALPSEEAKIKELAAEYGITNLQIEFSRSPQKWAEILEGATLAIHTHFSAYGQLGPYLQISLMRGVPCVITRFGPAEFLPDQIVFKVDAGNTEAFQITEVLNAVLSKKVAYDPSQIRSYAEQFFSAERCAYELANVLEQYAPVLAHALTVSESNLDQARLNLLERAKAGLNPLYSSTSLLEKQLGADFVWIESLAAAFDDLGWGKR